MKAKRILIQICLLCAAMLPAAVQAQFIFTTNNDGSLNIYQYTGSGGVVVIPRTNNGLTVTSIGDAAFNGCSSLTKVTIPSSVTTIGDFAFSSCSGLTSITIPSSVTSIGDDAFQVCSSLTSATIGSNATTIGDFAFQLCTSMTKRHDPQ